MTTLETHPKRAGAPEPPMSVALVTLGCARNEVDSEELAGRLEADGFRAGVGRRRRRHRRGQHLRLRRGGQEGLGRHPARRPPTSRSPAAHRPSWRSAAWPSGTASDLAESLPEADAVLGFDDYPDIAARLRSIVAGETSTRTCRRTGARCCRSHRRPARPRRPTPRRDRPTSPRAGPMAPLKLASGCDRRCTFCAIPRFRGSFVSRRPSDVLAEARWLADEGVRELFLVSENSTSYGKDLGDLRLLETMLPELAAVDGIDRVRVSYLQPAETRPGLVEAIAATPGVAAYYDLSFQHASATVLRRMRRFGDPDSFLGLLEQIRGLAPEAGSPLQRDRRLPRRDRGGPRDPVRLPRRRPDGRHRRLRLLRRGRHRGRVVRRQAGSTTRSGPGSSTSARSSTS